MSGAVDAVTKAYSDMGNFILKPFNYVVDAIGSTGKSNDIPTSTPSALGKQTKKQVNKKEDDVKNNITNYARYMYTQNPGASLGAGYLGL